MSKGSIKVRLENAEQLLNNVSTKLDEMSRAFQVHQHNLVLVTTHPSFSPEAAKYVKGEKENADSSTDKGKE